MKLSMTVDATVTLEYDPNLQVKKATYRERPTEQNQRAFFVLEMGEDRYEGTMNDLIQQMRTQVENKKLGEKFLTTLMEAFDLLIFQPIPEMEIDRERLIDEVTESRRRRRTWLLEQIEAGSYAAIEMLKDEFGDQVRIKVEVLGEAA